jgi:hypothetical protein
MHKFSIIFSSQVGALLGKGGRSQCLNANSLNVQSLGQLNRVTIESNVRLRERERERERMRKKCRHCENESMVIVCKLNPLPLSYLRAKIRQPFPPNAIFAVNLCIISLNKSNTYKHIQIHTCNWVYFNSLCVRAKGLCVAVVLKENRSLCRTESQRLRLSRSEEQELCNSW